MKCSFCEHELDLAMIRAQSCGACIGGCRKIHCPYCGQENPLVPEYLDRLLKQDQARDKDKES